MQTPQEPAHKPLIDEVLRKVGRNLVIFQQIERMLKAIALGAKQAGYIEELPSQLRQQRKRLAKRPMGEAADLSVEAMFGTEDLPGPPEDLRTVWVQTRFALEDVKVGQGDQLRKDIKAAVAQRNHLAHKLLDRWTMASPDSCMETSAFLDEQRESIMSLHSALHSILEARAEGLRAHAEFFKSDAFLEQLYALGQNGEQQPADDVVDSPTAHKPSV